MRYKNISSLLDLRIIVLLFLSVSVSLCLISLIRKLGIWFFAKTKFIENHYSDPISLLMFPSTYQEGVKKLQEVPPYKLYLNLLKDIVSKQRKFGGNYRLSFEDLRLAIHQDIKWENKLRTFFKESCFQYFGYIIFSWVLCLMFYLSGVVLGLKYYLCIFFWHSVGFLIFVNVILYRQKKMDGIFNDFVPILYQVIISSESQIQIDLEKLKFYKNERTRYYKNILSKLIRKRNSYGVSITQELQLLSQDFWNYWESFWEDSRQKLNRLKMAIIMLIFGTAYMMILFGISQQLIAGIFEDKLI